MWLPDSGTPYPMQLKMVLQQVPDPRGKQGQDYRLLSMLGLIVVSLFCGQRGMKAAFLVGRHLTRRQKAQLGFVRGTTPCHAKLTETLRVIDAWALANVLDALCLDANGKARHIAIGLASKKWRGICSRTRRQIGGCEIDFRGGVTCRDSQRKV
jgi:hypothetical protein